jgi:hypothetical protein
VFTEPSSHIAIEEAMGRRIRARVNRTVTRIALFSIVFTSLSLDQEISVSYKTNLSMTDSLSIV